MKPYTSQVFSAEATPKEGVITASFIQWNPILRMLFISPWPCFQIDFYQILTLYPTFKCQHTSWFLFHPSFLQHILSRQTHLLPCLLLIITSSNNSNLYIFLICLLALDIYLQNLLVNIVICIIPSTSFFPSNIYFSTCFTYKNHNDIFTK